MKLWKTFFIVPAFISLALCSCNSRETEKENTTETIHTKLNMVTSCVEYSTLGAGNEDGYYYIDYSNSDGSTGYIRYIDYNTASDIPLTTQIASENDDDTSESYLESTIGGGTLGVLPSKLLYLRCGSPVFYEKYGENALPAIYIMNLDGSDRKLLLQGKSNEEYSTTVASDDSNIYFLYKQTTPIGETDVEAKEYIGRLNINTLLAGLLCALCFSGLFSMERKGGMDEILASTPLGRKYTVKAKLWQSTAVAAVIAFGTVLPHLWQVLRDYGLPSLLGPAMSISDLQAVPKFITLSDLLIFWLICRFAACLCMSRITLWLGQKLGNLLTALFISAVAYCLPALLSLSGMKNGIEWLGFYPLFHAAALWQNQGYNANGESYNAMWIPIFLVCAAFFLAWAIGQALIDDYDMIGVPDEVL